MPPPLLLRVISNPDLSWTVQLGRPGERPAQHQVDAVELGGLMARVTRLLQRPSLGANALARAQADEEEAGRVLARIFRSTALTARLAEHLGECAATQEAPVLVVDSDSLSAANLPWELLAAGPESPALEESQRVAVVRLLHGRRVEPRPMARALRVLLWSPTPSDPACAQVLRGLRPTALTELLPLVDPRGPVLPRPRPNIADVLLIVGHGSLAEPGLVLCRGDADCGPGGVVAPLAAGLGQLAGVVLAVCDGGHPSAAQLSDLTGRLLLAGAPAVFSPAAPARADAVLCAVAALLRSLEEGASWPVAARAGRMAVAGLGSADPGSRPHPLRLHVGQLSALHGGLVTPTWSPPGWPAPDLHLGDLLERARAQARAQGWLGLEHLLAVWSPDEGRLARHLRCLVTGWDPQLQLRLRSGLRPGPTAGRPLRLTPRLRRLGGRLLSAMPGLDDLALALLEDSGHGLHALAERTLSCLHRRTLDSDAEPGAARPSAPAQPMNALEVIWGPEDGRLLIPQPGQTLGRWRRERGPELGLYAESPEQDEFLRHRHLRVLADGHVELFDPAQLIPAGGRLGDRVTVAGRVLLREGDLLLLTPSTWLRGARLPVPPS